MTAAHLQRSTTPEHLGRVQIYVFVSSISHDRKCHVTPRKIDLRTFAIAANVRTFMFLCLHAVGVLALDDGRREEAKK